MHVGVGRLRAPGRTPRPCGWPGRPAARGARCTPPPARRPRAPARCRPVARRGVARVGDHLPAPVEQVAEAAQVRHVHDLDGPEAQRPGLLPGPVDLDEAQVEAGVRHVGHRRARRRPRSCRPGAPRCRAARPRAAVRPPPASASGLQQEGPPEAVVGVEVRDHHDLDVVDGEPAAAQVRQRGGGGLHQDRCRPGRSCSSSGRAGPGSCPSRGR